MNNIWYNPQVNKYELKTKSDENKCCILKFSMCDNNKYQLYNLNSRNLKEFIKFAKKVESMPWKEIRVDPGLKYESLPELKGPLYISSDITLHSMRMSQKSRVIGYKENEFFYIVWFDNNHKTC